MRLVPGPDQLENLFKAAQEAEAAFGNPGLYMESSSTGPGTSRCRSSQTAMETSSTSESGTADSAPPSEAPGGGPEPRSGP